jgi:NAD(P)-dependent dehydrogenase (short-subunit alcohol dehydrogenase family)
MAGRLTGKVALITGAASGQGRAAARLFAKEGAQVVVTDVAVEGGEETVRLVRADGGSAAFVKMDVSKAAEVKNGVLFAVQTYGRLNILYNNAAMWKPGVDNRVVELEEEAWDTILSVNLKGVYLCCKYGIPELTKVGGGSVINTASIAGLIGSGNPTHTYAASKGGVIALTRAMAIAYAKDRVRVNVICPGGVDTPMIAPLITDENVRQRFAANHPIGRMGTPEDIAYLALYLAADESSWVTGSVFTIDGGYTAQ